MSTPHSPSFFHRIELSLLLTFIGVVCLFSGAIIVTLIAPGFVDSSWTQPSSLYQVQMYEVADPNIYISSANTGSPSLQYVYHIRKGFTLKAFQETETVRILASPELEKYVTRFGDPKVKLTSQLLLVRKAGENASAYREKLQTAWKADHLADAEQKQVTTPVFDVFELFVPGGEEAFAVAPTDLVMESWIDRDFVLIDEPHHSFHTQEGFVYVNNPVEYRLSSFSQGDTVGWRYDPTGSTIQTIDELKNHSLGFRSRKELIQLGEHIYAIEGCWYCHTDQTRTLVQDVVLNGSDSFPAPPSSANEYIYQKITFPGTRRIGPDLSRVGVKRPSRDWHKGHFWSPKTASRGSIMPAFRHFFDDDPRGTASHAAGIPNYQFEAVYQYLMTKGTRITPPNQAWWLGLDPIKTIEIIDGQRRLP